MRKTNTKQTILEMSLDLFAVRGYENVSVRDIAAAVNIKEASLYYHFKNKRQILEMILQNFDEQYKEVSDYLEDSIVQPLLLKQKPADFTFIQNYYCERFLLNTFCNKVLRVLLIEQLNDENMAAKFRDYVFTRGLRFQQQAFQTLEKTRNLRKVDLNEQAEVFHSCQTSLVFEFLLTGPLTEDKQREFSENMGDLILNLTRS